MSDDAIYFVIDYIDFVLNNFTFYGYGDNSLTREARTASLAVTQGMLNLINEMADDLLYNTTGILALQNLTGFSCSDFISGINVSLTTLICGNSNYNFGSASSLVPWIEAYIQGQYGQEFTNIQNLFNISLVKVSS
jgi:hypothetical protein